MVHIRLTEVEMSDLSRRRILLGGSVLGAGALLTACTSNNSSGDPEPSDQTKVVAGRNAEPGKKVTIGFSAPAADHGWIAAITNNAKAQAATYSDVTFNAVAASAQRRTDFAEGTHHATRNDRAGTNGREHGAPPVRRRPRMRCA